MEAVQDEINPFALMLDPQAVFAALERCESLENLKRRVYRPLEDPPGCDLEFQPRRNRRAELEALSQA